jgi:hypothetical protein
MTHSRGVFTRFAPFFSGFLIVAIAVLSGQASAKDEAQTEEPAGESSIGIYCAWALFLTLREVGSQCYTGQDSEFQEELRQTVARIETFVRQNSKEPLSEADIDEFKREQGHVGAAKEFLCHGDLVEMYRNLAARGPTPLRKEIDALLARPREPGWATCF